MNEKIAPKTVLMKTSIPAALRFNGDRLAEQVIQRHLMAAMTAEFDDMMTGGHRRAARQAEQATKDRARADARDLADKALRAHLDAAPRAWCIQQYQDDNGTEVLAVFATEEAANAALPMFEHKGDIEIDSLPFFPA